MGAQEKPGIEFQSVLDRAYKDYKRHLKVEDIMSRDVATTIPEMSMADAAAKMGEKHIGSLIVMQYGTPVGIVTERDLLTKVLSGGLNIAATKVGQVMSYPLIKICPEIEIREAARTMIRRKGRLAIFQCGNIAGVITASDLIREMPDAPETSLVVDEFMTTGMISVGEDETVAESARIMGKERVGSVIVMRGGEPVGIFTERDLLTSFLARGRPLDAPVSMVASSPLISAPTGISIHAAAKAMAARHIRRLILMKKKKIAGIITARDLVEAYAR